MLSLQASYLFQKDKLLYDVSFDTGDMSIQCGRTNDAFKIWLMWKKSVCDSLCGGKWSVWCVCVCVCVCV